MEKTFTEADVIRIAKQAVAEFAAENSVMTVEEAAEKLKVSTRTIHRMKPARTSSGRIAYRWVMDKLAERK